MSLRSTTYFSRLLCQRTPSRPCLLPTSTHSLHWRSSSRVTLNRAVGSISALPGGFAGSIRPKSRGQPRGVQPGKTVERLGERWARLREHWCEHHFRPRRQLVPRVPSTLPAHPAPTLPSPNLSAHLCLSQRSIPMCDARSWSRQHSCVARRLCRVNPAEV